MRACFHLLGMIGIALVVTSCQYDPDRVSDGDANPVIVEYRKIYSASKSIGPDSTLALLDQFLSNKEFENYAHAWNLKAFAHYQLSEFDQSLEAALKAKELDGRSGEFAEQLFMSKLAAGAGCDITDDELKNSINQHRIIMWRDWICIDSMPDSSRIAMAYPVTEEDTSNMVYRDLCFHLTNDSALVADTAIIGSLKNAEALQQAANSYFLQSDVSSNVLLLFQALR